MNTAENTVHEGRVSVRRGLEAERKGRTVRVRAGQGQGREGHCGVPSMESTLAKAHDPKPDRDMRFMSCLVWATQISSGGLRGNW